MTIHHIPRSAPEYIIPSGVQRAQAAILAPVVTTLLAAIVAYEKMLDEPWDGRHALRRSSDDGAVVLLRALRHVGNIAGQMGGSDLLERLWCMSDDQPDPIDRKNAMAAVWTGIAGWQN